MIKNILVIGAGIAGLTAAWKLRQRGFAVTVLEAGAQPGGRIKSIAFHGHHIETGAQFPSTGYRHIPSLFQETGLVSRVRPLSALAAIQRNQRLYRIHALKPWTPLTSGLLGAGEFFKLAGGTAKLSWGARKFDASCYAQFSAMDDAEAESWCRDNLGHAAAAHVIEPMIHGLYFHRLGGTSRALVAAVLSFGGKASQAVAGGWQALPQALAAQLDMRYDIPVDRLEETQDGVRVLAGGDSWQADAAVLATPSHVAGRILAAPIPQEEKVLSARYASTVHIALGLASTWRLSDVLSGALSGVYGCLLSPVEGGRIAALTFESGRGLGSGEGEVVSIMLGHDAAAGAIEQADEVIVQEVLRELETWLPGVSGSVVRSHVQRWHAAEPLSPVGRAAAIADYRASLPLTRKIALAGDYLGAPWTDGAAETGIWAAEHLSRLP